MIKLKKKLIHRKKGYIFADLCISVPDSSKKKRLNICQLFKNFPHNFNYFKLINLI
jgi:hypothetical protein